ncbi:GDP-mannose 4,6-dehydratase [Bradyrhizobium sp. BWA-3-5]|uniref:GDP-mannose 4,6-dehydratase n=1 Tax=Bradyrhizobium sp. BWA-3-5 TaxID=3080013 RepID=UPI00293EB78E|nr:GDP-mannose 4,6-dehydratase [Bradyrhizobium sp. BWA-3-5]WOH63912.1 GDP-mannose 4,6-dehydratase [Bradyrhizobium sp. BWA-3-5]
MSGFWSGKRVFLTWHTGFKRSWLVLWLQHLGAQVTGYALVRPPPTPSLFEITPRRAGMELNDMTNYDPLVSELRSAAADIVIHMAAQSLMRYSSGNPVVTNRTNVMGTMHLLQPVRQVNSVRAVPNISSDKCCENGEWISRFRENDRLSGGDPIATARPVPNLCPRPSITLFSARQPCDPRRSPPRPAPATLELSRI